MVGSAGVPVLKSAMLLGTTHGWQEQGTLHPRHLSIAGMSSHQGWAKLRNRYGCAAGEFEVLVDSADGIRVLSTVEAALALPVSESAKVGVPCCQCLQIQALVPLLSIR